VYGYLYRRLTTNQLDDGWKMLRRQLPGDDSDWDRCRRLADGVADRLNGYPSDARDAVFRSAWASDMSAATALEKSLFQRQKKRGMFSWFDDWF
jgi:hypothetical protein